MGDFTVQALGFALNGLTQQQQVLADNISNQDTPGFTASRVDFSASLQAALSSPDGGTASITVAPTTDPARADGNNVDLAGEVTAVQQNSLQYQAVIEALTNTFSMQRTAQDADF